MERRRYPQSHLQARLERMSRQTLHSAGPARQGPAQPAHCQKGTFDEYRNRAHGGVIVLVHNRSIRDTKTIMPSGRAP
jgi:hypothetical protein